MEEIGEIEYGGWMGGLSPTARAFDSGACRIVDCSKTAGTRVDTSSEVGFRCIDCLDPVS